MLSLANQRRGHRSPCLRRALQPMTRLISSGRAAAAALPLLSHARKASGRTLQFLRSLELAQIAVECAER